MIIKTTYRTILLVNNEWERFTPLQLAYLIILYENRLKTYTETSINKQLNLYHPNTRIWSAIARSLDSRGFIERNSINYNLYDTGLKLSDEFGKVENKNKLMNLFSYEYNIKVLEKYREIFKVIISKDMHTENDYEEIKNIAYKYNKELYKINRSIKEFNINNIHINQLILSLRKDTWYRVG